MTVFKSSLFIIIKNVIYGVLGGTFAAVILNVFIDLPWAIVCGILLGLLIIYVVIIRDNFKVVIEDDRFTVYRHNKVKYRFTLSEVSLNARIKTVDGDSDCTLMVTEQDGKTTYIDLSMLGQSRFYRLLDALMITDSEPLEVKTTKRR